MYLLSSDKTACLTSGHADQTLVPSQHTKKKIPIRMHMANCFLEERAVVLPFSTHLHWPVPVLSLLDRREKVLPPLASVRPAYVHWHQHISEQRGRFISDITSHCFRRRGADDKPWASMLASRKSNSFSCIKTMRYEPSNLENLLIK
jgi:hypothetical protein